MPKMVLDVSRTTASVIPEKLEGVDCLLARQGQIKYIAPDYLKEIIFLELSDNGTIVRTPVRDSERQFLVRCYQARTLNNPEYFEESSKERTGSYFEEFLPKNLKFSWDYQRNCGKLNAQETNLTSKPTIVNVDEILMPRSFKNHVQINDYER